MDCIHRNGNITGYSIQYHMRGSGVLMYITSSLRYTIPELQPSTEYVIGVAAVNNAGVRVYENINISTLPCKYQVVSIAYTIMRVLYTAYTCSCCFSGVHNIYYCHNIMGLY